MDTINRSRFRVRASTQLNHKTFSTHTADGAAFDWVTPGDGSPPRVTADMNRRVLGNGPAIILAILAIAAALASPAFAQSVTNTPGSRAVMIVSGDSPPYLQVDDCIRGFPCKQLGREQAVPVNGGFMFFSVFSTGVDVKAHHRILLKIAGTAIPDAIGALVREDAHTQRIYFLVDLHRYEHVPPARSSNIDVWVDGKIITSRGVEH
jgi:hypothetical protein